jgi:hypothetical protein
MAVFGALECPEILMQLLSCQMRTKYGKESKKTNRQDTLGSMNRAEQDWGHSSIPEK